MRKLLKSTLNSIGGSIAAVALFAASTVSAFAVSYDNGYAIVPGANTTAAPTGQIGEVATCTVGTGSPVTLTTTATGYNVCSVSVTAGRWLCVGTVDVNLPAATTMPSIYAAWNTVTATMPTVPAGGSAYGVGSIAAAATGGGATAITIEYVATTPTSLYLNTQAAFTGTAPNVVGAGTCYRLG